MKQDSTLLKVLAGLMMGPVMGGGAAFIVHSFIGRTLAWLAQRSSLVAVAVVVTVKLPYYAFAWPGIKLGEALGWISFVPLGAAPPGQPQDPRASPAALGRCPFAGTVYTNEGHPRVMYLIRPDWKVDLERQTDWGYIDARGQIRKYHGPNPFSILGPALSPYEDGYDPTASLSGDGVLARVARVQGYFCLNGAYGSELVGHWRP